MADFLFLDVEDASDMLDHLFVGDGHFQVGWAFGRWRGNNVGCVASAVDWGRGARRNKDGGIGGHGKRRAGENFFEGTNVMTLKLIAEEEIDRVVAEALKEAAE